MSSNWPLETFGYVLAFAIVGTTLFICLKRPKDKIVLSFMFLSYRGPIIGLLPVLLLCAFVAANLSHLIIEIPSGLITQTRLLLGKS